MVKPLFSSKVTSLGLACVLTAALAACSNTPTTTPRTTAVSTAATSIPTTATGVTATTQPVLPFLNEAIDTVNQVAAAKDWTPFDAVPSPDGLTVYFTVNGNSGPAVYKVSASGGMEETMASGAPLVAPCGLSISTNGQTLYVADVGADTTPGGNAIFAIPTGGGSPTRLEQTVNTRPNVPEVVSENGADMLYYSGFDPSDKQPVIFKLNPAKAETPTVVFKGAPLVAPSGIAVTKSGIVYVADMASDSNDVGAVYRIQNGIAERLANQLHNSGWIAGTALTLDESALLVSNLHAEKGTAQVLVINIATGELGLINKGIGGNSGAGGLHRAYGVNQFSWADVTRSPPRSHSSGLNSVPSSGGGVYFLTTPRK